MKLPTSPRSRLQLLGAAILIIGFCAAASIWIAQDRLDRQATDMSNDPAAPLQTFDSKKQVSELQRYYGNSGILLEESLEWLQSLAHGKRLATTLAVASSILGIGCFLAADMIFPVLEAAEPAQPDPADPK